MFGRSECRLGQLREFTHTGRFSLGYLAAIIGDAIVAPTFIVEMGIGPVGRFFNKPQLEHLVDGSVEHTGSEF